MKTSLLYPTLIYLMLNEDVLVDRQYSHGAALTLRAYWASPASERAAIAKAAGLQLVAEDDVPVGEQHWPYSDIFSEQMRAELGEDTQVRIRAQTPPSLWVNAPSLGPGWIRVPLYPHPLRGQRVWNLVAWFLGIGLLSTAAAWIFVRQLSAPLKRLVIAARLFGQGRSVRLPVEQAGRERELMLAGVSHDLRTPLTRLRLSLELLDSDNDLTNDMVRDIEDMNAILDQFLAFIRDGRDEPMEACDLNELISSVVAPYIQQGRPIRLCLEEMPSLELRRVSIKRMLVNLLENALRYGEQGIEVAASVVRDEHSAHVAISVLDRGPGLDPEDLQRIFNPFYRGDQARGGQGAGLGLAIVQRIAAQHGGKVELQNRAGGGLDATVCLPIAVHELH